MSEHDNIRNMELTVMNLGDLSDVILGNIRSEMDNLSSLIDVSMNDLLAAFRIMADHHRIQSELLQSIGKDSLGADQQDTSLFDKIQTHNKGADEVATIIAQMIQSMQFHDRARQTIDVLSHVLQIVQKMILNQQNVLKNPQINQTVTNIGDKQYWMDHISEECLRLGLDRGLAETLIQKHDRPKSGLSHRRKNSDHLDKKKNDHTIELF